MPDRGFKGLALASAQKSQGLRLLPSSLFERGCMAAVEPEEATTRLTSSPFSREMPIISPELDQQKRNHALSILAKIMQNPQFAPKEMQKYKDAFKRLTAAHGVDIWRYTEQWISDLSQPGEIERKMEECIWTNTIIYAIGGWCKEKGFTANIFL
jgi:hypothetical protein